MGIVFVPEDLDATMPILELPDVPDVGVGIHPTVTMAALGRLAGLWTPAQSRAVAGALRGLSQSEIAQQEGVSQPAVSQRLDAGLWGTVQLMLEEVEAVTATWLVRRLAQLAASAESAAQSAAAEALREIGTREARAALRSKHP